MVQQQVANEIRMLCADMVQAANSGHPGAPMGLADIAVVLASYINIVPEDSKWINRDRLVFSGGHASALLYSLLHLWGYDVGLSDLQSFRQLHSKTPGHPEYNHTHGVEITTGPLGQGVANAVGFAMAAKRASVLLGEDLINHKVYCFCGDGDLEEGISYEACSLAGHQNLNNLIIIYDSNNISIEGDIGIAFSEDVTKRFEAQGFFVTKICGHNYEEISVAFHKAIQSDKPVLIIANTKIAKNAFKMEGSHHAHGAPLGEDIIKESKRILGFDSESKFHISEQTRQYFEENKQRTQQAYKTWLETLQKSAKKSLLESLLLKDNSAIVFPEFITQDSSCTSTTLSYPKLHTQTMATRASNGVILNAIAKYNQGFIGGSADLSPSNNTELKGVADFPNGNNIHFGIREHAMGAICNAFANYGIFTPYCATFFVFSDYLCPSIRVASLMNTQVFYIFTHDSIGVGEDGATHQPVEQLSHLRAMPNLLNWRVADANENVVAWQVALNLKQPQSFILTRQNLPLIESVAICKENVAKGAYLLSKSSILQSVAGNTAKFLTLVASGSEVHLVLKAQIKLEEQGIATQVVSMPCFELFMAQGKQYHSELFGDSKVLAIEASRALELYSFADDVISMQGFGASGKGDVLFEYFGFSVENICKRAGELFV